MRLKQFHKPNRKKSQAFGCSRYSERSEAESRNSAENTRRSSTGSLDFARDDQLWSSFQMFNQLQHVPPVFRGNSPRAVMRSAVLPLVALLEQTAKAVARLDIQIESVGGRLRVHNVWLDPAVAGGDGSL